MYPFGKVFSYQRGQIFDRCGGNPSHASVMQDEPLLCLLAHPFYFTQR